MKKFFINNGNWLTMALACIFFMTDLIGDYLPDFSNTYLTFFIDNSSRFKYELM